MHMMMMRLSFVSLPLADYFIIELLGTTKKF